MDDTQDFLEAMNRSKKPEKIEDEECSDCERKAAFLVQYVSRNRAGMIQDKSIFKVCNKCIEAYRLEQSYSSHYRTYTFKRIR